MLKRLLANKKMLILIVAVVLIVVGVLIVVLTKNDSKEDGKSGVSIKTDKDKDSEASEDDTYKDYSGEGLEVQETLDESVYTIDGSGNWNDSSEGNGKTNNVSSDDKQSNDKQPDDAKKEESDNIGNDSDGELDSDILVDDKVWGEPS